MGITCSSIFQSEYNLSLNINETKTLNKYSYKFKNTKIYNENNYQELIAVFEIYKNKKYISKVKPSKRYYHVSKMITTEAGIYRHWFQDFYFVIGNETNGKWDIKIYQNPLVNLIWLGVILMIISGLVGIRKR
jgi:cytochrome c-type biogenesis protein CcmF